MLKRMFILSALAAAALVFAPATSEAQYRGGGGRGYGGFGPGAGYGRYGPGYGYGNQRFYGGSGITIGIGTPGYGNRYYGGGYYGGRYFSPGYYPGGYFTSAPAVTQTYDAFYPPPAAPLVTPTAPNDATASIAVRVPANAQVWWNGSPSTTAGELRFFRTAPLSNEGAAQRFQARWTGSDGQTVTQTRDVQATPGGTFTVDFLQPAQTQPAPAQATPSAPPIPPPPAPNQNQ